MREGGVYFRDMYIEKKMLKIDTFISLCDNSAHNKAIQLKFKRFLSIICEISERNDIVNFFQSREDQSSL